MPIDFSVLELDILDKLTKEYRKVKNYKYSVAYGGKVWNENEKSMLVFKKLQADAERNEEECLSAIPHRMISFYP